MNKVERIKELVQLLHKAAIAYYGDDNPILSDKQYDDLYDELCTLEEESGYILIGSPTQKVQGVVVDFLEKVDHKEPMLSSDKTKDLEVVHKFIGNKEVIQSWKLDGLTVVAIYKNGLLHRAITRGNGTIGEDVTHTFKHCVNLPIKLREPIDITFRGECVIPWETFKKINSELEKPYSHPRNLAAGTLRQLNANIAIERNLEYYVFQVVEGFSCGNYIGDLAYASSLDMPVVEHCMVKDLNICVNAFKPEEYKLPVDGLIYKYDDVEYGKSLGSTSKYPLDMLALKWEDELYETTLTDIEWNTSKTGLINPVAIFDTVNLDGADTTRATLHNISYIEDLKLGVGDTIQVYRANMVIPKVHKNLTRSNTWKLPDKCPSCGGQVEIQNENGSKTLHCCNEFCKAKLLARLVHYASRNALNIDGFSEATIEKFMKLGWLTSISNIYTLFSYKDEMMKLDGLGKKSAEKLLESIEKSKKTTLSRFLYGLSIPLIGSTASKAISKYFDGDYVKFIEAIEDKFDFTKLDDFGQTMNNSIYTWYVKYSDNEDSYIPILLDFEKPSSKQNENLKSLSGLTFCITGSLNHYTNRDALKAVIEGLNGKVTGSVTSKTTYLINNDLESKSSKNTKALSLNIPIITEEKFIQMFN